jgi:hypothetical protein
MVQILLQLYVYDRVGYLMQLIHHAAQKLLGVVLLEPAEGREHGLDGVQHAGGLHVTGHRAAPEIQQ